MNKFYLIIFLILCYLMLLWGLGGYDLVDPDEPRFGLVAKEMINTHQWVLPHRNEHSYPDKPPFFFWCISLVSILVGEVNSFAARTPSLLGALGVLFLIYHWAKKDNENNNDSYLALLTTCLLLTTYLFFYEARTAQIDMLMCFFVTGAMIEAYQLLSGKRQNVWPMAIYMGLGTITKGPIAFILPMGVSITYIFFNKLKWKSLPWRSLLISFIIPLIWLTFLLIEVIKNDEWSYLRNILFKQTVVRYADSWHHIQPFYYFSYKILHDLFPWTPFFFIALFFSVNKWKSISNKEKFAWCVCLFVLVFFSIPKGKRNIYILPIYPFIAYILAISMIEYLKRSIFPKLYKRVFVSLLVIFLIASLCMTIIGTEAFPLFSSQSMKWVLKHYNINLTDKMLLEIPYVALLWFGIAIFSFTLLGFYAIKKESFKLTLGVLMVLILQINLLLFQVILPNLNSSRSFRGFMQAAIEISAKNNTKPIFGMVNFREGFRFYSDQHIIELNAVKGFSKNGTYGVSKFWELYPDGYLIVKQSIWKDHLQNTSVRGEIIYEKCMEGRTTYYLVKKGNY